MLILSRNNIVIRTLSSLNSTNKIQPVKSDQWLRCLWKKTGNPMMDSKLQSNAVLSGYIHSYCLVCECYFDTAEDTTNHIEGVEHTDKLAAHPYLEKYGDNHIRKVSKGYYCEFCSLLLATAAKVSLHIHEKAHFDKKGTFLLCRPPGQPAVLAFDDLLIDERAWHSLSEDTCAVCNEEFDNENIHKSDSGHLLKLLQVKVEFAPGNNLYRKTDDSSFQCLTCNSVFILNSLNEHFTKTEHKNLYSKCQAEYKKYMEQCKSKVTEKATDVKETKKVKDDVKSIKSEGAQKTEMNSSKPNATSQNSDVKTQKEDRTQKAVAKVEKKIENVDKNQNNLNDKPKMEVTVNDFGSGQIVVAKISKTEPEPDEAAIFANANNLTYNSGNNNAFCRICETKLPSPLRSMKEHVNGKEHKSRLAKVNQTSVASNIKPRITKVPMSKFINESLHVHNIFHDDVVVNEKYCVPVASFVMVTRLWGRCRCQVCEESVHEDDLGEHTSSLRHERAMRDTPVLTCLPDTEFCREVRPSIYHCGYCNLILPRWDDLSKHLQSREHKDNKDECMWRLQRHLPRIAMERQYDLFRMLMMGQMFRR